MLRVLRKFSPILVPMGLFSFSLPACVGKGDVIKASITVNYYELKNEYLLREATKNRKEVLNIVFAKIKEEWEKEEEIKLEKMKSFIKDGEKYAPYFEEKAGDYLEFLADVEAFLTMKITGIYHILLSSLSIPEDRIAKDREEVVESFFGWRENLDTIWWRKREDFVKVVLGDVDFAFEMLKKTFKEEVFTFEKTTKDELSGIKMEKKDLICFIKNSVFLSFELPKEKRKEIIEYVENLWKECNSFTRDVIYVEQVFADEWKAKAIDIAREEANKKFDEMVEKFDSMEWINEMRSGLNESGNETSKNSGKVLKVSDDKNDGHKSAGN